MANNKNRSGGRFNRFNRNGSGITRNTVFDSTGPYGRMRGTASQLIEKYLAAAKEIRHNDRILSEVLLQHADHYARLLAMATASETRIEPEMMQSSLNASEQETSSEEMENLPREETASSQQEDFFNDIENQQPPRAQKHIALQEESAIQSETESQPDAAALKELPFMEVPVLPAKKQRRRLTLSKITKNQEVENP